MIDSLQIAGASLLGGFWPVAWALIKIVVVLLPLLGCVAYLTLWERKAIACSSLVRS
jgi:NADH-quinone oxidoreductase subunit H